MGNTSIHFVSTENWDLSQFPVAEIKVATENDLLYERFASANDDDQRLIQSVLEHGILEPLVISADRILLSGHRRLASAKRIGLTFVPVRINPVIFGALSGNEKLTILQLYNNQREKTFEESVRERLVNINSKEAHGNLTRQRVARLIADAPIKSNVALKKYKPRNRITTKQFLEAVVKVIFENEQYWPLTDRRVHYLLLNDPPLRHDNKPDSTYKNDAPCYKALTNLIARARLIGEIPMRAIEDPTRPISLNEGYDSSGEFIERETRYFLTGFARNLMAEQKSHIEVVLEKNALRSVVLEVTQAYCIPLTVSRGYCSIGPRHDIAQRYFRSGKDRLILLFLTDFDPDGQEIARSFAQSMQNDFGIKNLVPHKVLLNHQDILENDLPSDIDAKETSPHYIKFVSEYGTKVVELDAAPVLLIQRKLKEAIEAVIDIAAFNRQLELEERDAVLIAAKREAVLRFMGVAKK
jgi:hypothetical protein